MADALARGAQINSPIKSDCVAADRSNFIEPSSAAFG
jgi:hypothetical protein